MKLFKIVFVLLFTSFAYAEPSLNQIATYALRSGNSDVTNIDIGESEDVGQRLSSLTGVGYHRYKACDDSEGYFKEISFTRDGEDYNCLLTISKLPFSNQPKGKMIYVEVTQCAGSESTFFQNLFWQDSQGRLREPTDTELQREKQKKRGCDL